MKKITILVFLSNICRHHGKVDFDGRWGLCKSRHCAGSAKPMKFQRVDLSRQYCSKRYSNDRNHDSNPGFQNGAAIFRLRTIKKISNATRTRNFKFDTCRMPGVGRILQVLPGHDCLGEQASGGIQPATQGRGCSFNPLFHKLKFYPESWDPGGTGLGRV